MLEGVWKALLQILIEMEFGRRGNQIPLSSPIKKYKAAKKYKERQDVCVRCGGSGCCVKCGGVGCLEKRWRGYYCTHP